LTELKIEDYVRYLRLGIGKEVNGDKCDDGDSSANDEVTHEEPTSSTQRRQHVDAIEQATLQDFRLLHFIKQT